MMTKMSNFVFAHGKPARRNKFDVHVYMLLYGQNIQMKPGLRINYLSETDLN
jgi:hypothetical protein